MSLVLDVVRDGIIEAGPVLDVAHIDPDPTIAYLEDLYWRSGDLTSRTVQKWKEDNAANFYGEFDVHSGRGHGLELLRQVLGKGINVPVGMLHLAQLLGNGDIIDLGLVSAAVVTDVGCQKIVSVMNTADATTGVNFKYHALGTGSTAEAAGDTALVTELTTEYTGNVRATGSQTTGATTKVYRTVGTNTLDSGTPAVVEHGILSQAATGGGSLLDRSVFSAINLVGANGDGIQSTYDLTFTSGG